MAITNTTLGPNSVQIDYDPGTVVTDLMNAIETYILAHGWTLWDNASLTVTPAGANARAYRSLNKDGSTYKYIVLNYNNSGYIFLQGYEYWNNVTHVGTNPIGTYTSTAAHQKMDLTAGAQINVFATTRYIGLLSYVAGQYGISSTLPGGSWIFEIARDNPEDTPGAGYPAIVFTESGFFSTSYAPRVKTADLTGVSASYTALITVGGNFGDSEINAWNSKHYACTPILWKQYSGNNTQECKGRVFGCKSVTTNLGTMFDTIDIAIDSDYLVDPSGTVTTHWIFIGTTTGNRRFAVPQ